MSTAGDVEQAGPIGSLGLQGVFTKKIQRSLLEGRVDLAVHSLKDLPTDPVPGILLAAIPEREAVGDVLVASQGSSLEDLPTGAVVGTGSLRRQAQLRHVRPDLELKDIRGNVETRLRKLDDGDYDAIILAEAGLIRLNLTNRITQRIPTTVSLPAVGQGALGIECREDDARTIEALASLNHESTCWAVLAERSMLATLRGGCLAPVGAWGRIEEERLVLTGRVVSIDGKTLLETMQSENPENAIRLGEEVAQELKRQGADALIAQSRADST